jgi:hypothetical protein
MVMKRSDIELAINRLHLARHNEADCDTEIDALRSLIGSDMDGDDLIAAAWDAIREIDEGE